MNPYGKKNTAGIVWDLIEPTADELGYSLWNVEYVREGADMYLRVTIDSEDGISIDDCERMTRAIDPILDEADPIEDSYYLEVSSPGVERTLTTDDHFAAMAGAEVELKLFRAENGAKSVRGVLVGRDADNVTLTVRDEEVKIARANVAKASTVYDWSEDMKK